MSNKTNKTRKFPYGIYSGASTKDTPTYSRTALGAFVIALCWKIIGKKEVHIYRRYWR